MSTTPLEFNIPPYARPLLWLSDAAGWQQQLSAEAAPLDAATLQVPLTLHWAHPQGSPLQRWHHLPATLRWQGTVQVSGYIERSHLLSLGQLGEMLLLEVMGHLEEGPRLPSLDDLQQGPYQPSIYRDSDDQPPHWYSFLLPLDSALADFAQQGLLHRSSITCYGALAGQQSRLHHALALPLLLDSLSFHSL